MSSCLYEDEVLVNAYINYYANFPTLYLKNPTIKWTPLSRLISTFFKLHFQVKFTGEVFNLKSEDIDMVHGFVTLLNTKSNFFWNVKFIKLRVVIYRENL